MNNLYRIYRIVRALIIMPILLVRMVFYVLWHGTRTMGAGLGSMLKDIFLDLYYAHWQDVKRPKSFGYRDGWRAN